jgi:hypothetical protein
VRRGFSAQVEELRRACEVTSVCTCVSGVSPEVGVQVFIGMLIGANVWGWLADLKGRRAGFLYPALFSCFAGVASAAAPNFASLLVWCGPTRCRGGECVWGREPRAGVRKTGPGSRAWQSPS